jgi:hypothetical protein
VILTAAKSTAIGVGTGGDIIISGAPNITMGSGGIGKLFSGLESTSSGLTTLAGGSSNVRYNYDETTSTFSPVLSANNKHAIYRTNAGVGELTIVSSNGDAINSTWTYTNGVISTIASPVNILASVVESYLSSGPLTINAGNTTISSAITSTASNALVLTANSTLSNTTPTTAVNAAITNAGSITINTGTFNVAQNITTSSTAAITISATNQISTSTATRRSISTQGGNITLNADVDANGIGWLDIDDLTLNPGAGNIILRGETFNNNLDQSRKPYINGTGSFTYESNDAAFGEAIGSNWFVIDQDANGISGFTIGKSGNTVTVYINTSFTVAGTINVYGGYVEISGNITSSADGDIFIKSLNNGNPSVYIGAVTINKSAGTGTLTFQANGRVTNYGTLSATGTGLLNVVMWSDYDNTNNDGGVSQFGTISTNGGHVWLGGSNTSNGSYTWNDLTVGDGPSIGTSGYNCNALDLFGPITTGGGDVLLWASSPGCGTSSIAADATRLINAGSGDITLIAYQTSGAIELTSTGVISLLPHAGSYASALTLGGTLTSGNFTFNTSFYNGLKINSLSSVGGLTIGKYTELLNSGTAVTLGNTSNITFSSAATIAGPIIVYGGTIALEANLTTTNNGDISLYTDAAIGGLTAARTITAAGSFNYIPRSDFFSVPVTYPITNLNLTSSGLLIGKPTNTAAITFGNATTIAGPITAYGGTITLDANLSTTSNGNISLYTDNALGGLGTARTLTAAGAFKYIPRGNVFSADVTYPITNLTATSTGLTIGKTTNDKNITITQDVTGPFDIELYGNNVNINSNLTTTGINAIMYLKGNTTIAAGKSITSGGNFTHDGTMTFKSNATGTAAFGTLGGTFTTVSGTSTVERYIPAKRAYRFISPSVTTTTSIRDNWQENGGTDGGLGTHITGLNGSANGFDSTTTNNPSLYTINHTTGLWAPVTNTNVNTLSAGTAYRLMVRGDRTISLATNAPTATVTTLRATGVLKTGSHSPTLNQASEGYSFVGNPYQAPVDIKAVLAASTNMNSGVVYYWDPTLNGRGAYITRNLTSNQNSPSSNFNQYLQPGQAVFVKKTATASPASMLFTESNKSVTNSAAGVFRTTTEFGTLRTNLRASINNQWTTIEGALAVFSPMYSWEVTQDDANKLSNLDEEVSFMQNNTSLAIACQPNPSATNELPIRLNTTRHTNYQWQFELGNYSGPTPYLFDTQNNTYTLIDNNTIVPFTVNGQELTRFKIVFQNGTLSTPDFSNQIVLYPNPGASGASSFNIEGITDAQVSLFTLLGQNIPVRTATNGKGMEVISKTSLSKGVYLVGITKDGKTSHVKWIVE